MVDCDQVLLVDPRALLDPEVNQLKLVKFFAYIFLLFFLTNFYISEVAVLYLCNKISKIYKTFHGRHGGSILFIHSLVKKFS